MTGNPVQVARNLHDRKLQRGLMQFFKPEYWFDFREALLQAGLQDLIGSGCDSLIPAQAPKEALEARRRRASDAGRDDITTRLLIRRMAIRQASAGRSR